MRYKLVLRLSLELGKGEEAIVFSGSEFFFLVKPNLAFYLEIKVPRLSRRVESNGIK